MYSGVTEKNKLYSGQQVLLNWNCNDKGTSFVFREGVVLIFVLPPDTLN